MEIPGGGTFFGHTRSYGNQASFAYDGPNGFNWFLRQMPYAVADGTSVAIVFDSNNPYWFDKSGTSYVPRYGMTHVSLTEDAVDRTFVFKWADGSTQEVTVFTNFAASSPGSFVRHTDATGVTTSVTSTSGNQVNEMQRSVTVSGVTTIDSLVYTYYGGAASGKIQYVTWRRRVGTGAWSAQKRVKFTYYGSGGGSGSGGSSTSALYGKQNDLETAQQQLPNGTGGWNTFAVRYYRYYTTGFIHGLKLHFGPEAYRQLFNAGLLSASDTTVQPYADHYFVYDTNRRVTQEVAAVCPGCPGGGTTSDTFVYSQNPTVTNPTDPTLGYNYWVTKTTQTLPDGSQIVAYTNYCGLPMLTVTIDTSGNMWGTFYLYDANGHLLWEAMPSALALPSPLNTVDSYNDLMHYVSGTGYAYLQATSGLVKVTTYDSSGFVLTQGVQQGQNGTPILTAAYTYSSNTDSDGNTVNPVASIVQYPSAGTTTPSITTGFTYTWYTGSNRLLTKTTTLPPVGSGQNGDGASPTIIEQYDQYGYLTSQTDERGIVNQFVYDDTTHLATEQTLNVQSGVTQPGVNVVTDFTYDNLGRLVQTLGPSHTVVLSGTATTVRGADWTVYALSFQPSPGTTWELDQTRQGTGYATGTGPSYTYTLVDPVSLTNTDKDGRLTDQITSKRTTGSGALSPSDTFAQTDWQTWSSTQYNSQHQTISGRVYFLIPSTGTGSAGTNYGQMTYGYDALERRNRVVAPEGTITRTVWNAMQWVDSIWVGTDDTGATDSNPAGSGSPNNMVIVTANQYDGGSGGGDGNLTQATQYVSATSGDTRVTSYGYDFRDRRVSFTDALGGYTVQGFDNLDRPVTVYRYVSSTGNLISARQTNFDDRGRICKDVLYPVDPTTGTEGYPLVGNSWYDYSGNLLQQIVVGDGIVFSKAAYNGVGWVTDSYRGYNSSGTSYSQATTVANDIIVEQTSNTYDEAGNLVSQTFLQRLNDTPSTGTGSAGALSYGTQPKARVSYTANWFDGVDRQIATANYGAISSFTRPTTPPSSATVLVSLTSYDSAGRVQQTTDAKGVVNQTSYDNASRTTQTIEDYGTGTLNRATNYTYTLDNQIATLTAMNSTTGDQTTTYAYGTSSTSGVYRNDLLASITYPDSVSGSDVMSYTYNRLTQMQRGMLNSNKITMTSTPAGFSKSSW